MIATVGSTSWFDTGLAAGSTHTYAVVAIDAANNPSAQSSPASATTTAADTTAPTVPSGLAATASAWNSVNLSWAASTDAVGVTSYTISRNGSALSKVAGNATSFVDVATQPATAYTYNITASDAAGNTSAASNTASVTTPATPPPDTTAPSTPTALAGTVKSGTEIDLAWTGSTDNVAVAGYRLYRDGNGTPIATVGSTTWFDIGLVAGSSHTYQVSAVDAAGNESVKTAALAETTPNVAPPDGSAPSIPAGVTASTTASNSATVSWTASTDNVAVSCYTISRNGTAISKVAATATRFVDATTLPATTYAYTVTATDAAGNTSAPSSAASVTTPATATPPADTQKPSVPAGLTATAAPGEIDLAWTASTDDTAVAGYTVLRDGTAIATTYTPAYADLNVAAGSPHTYTVAAFDGSANASDPSAGATATPGLPLPVSVTYTYDLADRLTAITTASGTITGFSFDALGRHASQTIGAGPSSTYSYLGTSDTVVAIVSGSTTTASAIDALGDRVATGSAGAFGYLLADLHGNTACAFGASGSISDAFAYDAYGNLVASVTSALPTPWRYQGRILESAAGTPELYDFGSRSYNPALGTFTSLDTSHGSAQNPALLNGYLYANANPATLVDPDGNAAISGCANPRDPSCTTTGPSNDVSYVCQNGHAPKGYCASNGYQDNSAMSKTWAAQATAQSKGYEDAAAAKKDSDSANSRLMRFNANTFYNSIDFTEHPLDAIYDEATRACFSRGTDTFSRERGCFLHYNSEGQIYGMSEPSAIQALLELHGVLIAGSAAVSLVEALPGIVGGCAEAGECLKDLAAEDSAASEEALSNYQKGLLGSEFSEVDALSRGDEIIGSGRSAQLEFNIGGQAVRIDPDLLVRTADGKYVYVESKFSQMASYTTNQSKVIPSLVSSGDDGLSATVVRSVGDLTAGQQIQVIFQGDVWNGSSMNPDLYGR